MLYSALESYKSAEDEGNEIVGIPQFWMQCLSYHPATRAYITDDDYECIEALTDIKCVVNDDYTGFKLSFHFKENDFFDNTILEKTYVVSPDLLDENFPSLESASGTAINWKPGKNLCEKEIQKKQQAKSGKKKGQTRTVTKIEQQESFFHFFSDPKQTDDDEEDDEDEKEQTDFRLSFEDDYDIAHAIRTSLLPEAILWYTGENVDDDDDFDEDDDDDDDEEEEEDDEDDEDAPKLIGDHKKGFSVQKPPGGPKGPKGKPASGLGSSSEQSPECKQT